MVTSKALFMQITKFSIDQLFFKDFAKLNQKEIEQKLWKSDMDFLLTNESL